MGAAGAGQPGRRESRYAELAGGLDDQRTLYWARKTLGFSIDEWLALPWWQQKLYVDMHNDEVAQQERKAEEQQRAQRRGTRGRQHSPGRSVDSRLPIADGSSRPAGGEKVKFGDLLARRQAGAP